MEQLNRIELRGTVGGVRLQNYNELTVAHFTLVTNYAYKDKEGTPVIESTWHNVTAWEGKDIPDLSSIDKGTKLYVIGRLRTQKYTGADGVDRVSTEVVARRIVVIEEDQQLQCEMS